MKGVWSHPVSIITFTSTIMVGDGCQKLCDVINGLTLNKLFTNTWTPALTAIVEGFIRTSGEDLALSGIGISEADLPTSIMVTVLKS